MLATLQEAEHPDSGTAFSGALPEHLIHYLIREAHKENDAKSATVTES